MLQRNILSDKILKCYEACNATCKYYVTRHNQVMKNVFQHKEISYTRQ